MINNKGLSEIQISGKKYIVVKLIRSSRISDVYHVKQKGTQDLEYILKILSPKEEFSKGNVVLIERDSNNYEKYKKAFIQEVKISQKVSDNFYEIFGNGKIYTFFDSVDSEHAFLLLKYFKMDTLEKYIENCNKNNQIYAKENIILLLVKCVHNLHKHGILHLDISPDNILVGDSDKSVILIDYGNAVIINKRLSLESPLFYKKLYSPPELRQKPCQVGIYTDIYSLGMTIKYILTGSEKKEIITPADDFKTNIYYRWFLKRCLYRNPKKRFQSCATIYVLLCIHKYRRVILICIISILIFLVCIINYLFIIDKKAKENPPETSNIYTNKNLSNDDIQFKYETVNNKIYITGSLASLTDIVIPKEIDNIPVIAVQGVNKNVTSIVISEGVERIEDYAFQNCQYLQSIQIPKSIGYISEYAFINCGKLKEIDISSDNKIYELVSNKIIQKSDGKVIYEIQN